MDSSFKKVKMAVLEGFDKPVILVGVDAETKMKPQHKSSVRGFHYCNKEEDEQKNGFCKGFHYTRYILIDDFK